MGVVMVNVTIMGPLYYYMQVKLPVILLGKLKRGSSPWGCTDCEVFWVTPRQDKKPHCWMCDQEGRRYTRNRFNEWDMRH